MLETNLLKYQNLLKSNEVTILHSKFFALCFFMTHLLSFLLLLIHNSHRRSQIQFLLGLQMRIEGRNEKTPYPKSKVRTNDYSFTKRIKQMQKRFSSIGECSGKSLFHFLKLLLLLLEIFFLFKKSGTLVDEEHQKFVQTIAELQSALHMVQTQLSAKSKELAREKKITDMNATRIIELQGALSKKSCEINKLQSAYNDIKREFDVAIIQMTAQQNTIKDLEDRYEKTVKNNEENCAHSLACQQEISACLLNLQSLKEKIKGETQMLEERTQQYEELKSNYNDLLLKYEELSCKFDKAETKHNDEVLSYKHTVIIFF